MELLLIRHALPVRRELEDGIADPQLSPEGLAQADRLADYLSSEKIHAVYASPLQRAQQTAAPLALNQEPQSSRSTTWPNGTGTRTNMFPSKN